MSSQFNFNALTNFDDNYWRVDWFGYLSYFDIKGQRRSEPLVDVFLSKFKQTPNSASLNYKASTHFDEAKRVQLPISYLRILRLGDVWHKGNRYSLVHDKKMRSRFTGLCISNSNTQTLAASAKYDENYILPFSHHPYHSNATKTYCEIVKLANNNLIIVPHYVILQAYFSSSQYVFNQLFTFGLDLDSIYDSNSSYLDTEGKAFVLLKKWTHDVAAPEIARIAFDPQASRAVRGISQQLALQASREDKIRPKTKMPFSGSTDLDVFGKWLPLAAGQQAFIVYDILGCTAPYPFNALEYFRDNPGDPDDKAQKKPKNDIGGDKYRKPKPTTKSSDKVELEPHSEPGNQYDELELPSRSGTQFRDLNNKSITKKRQTQHKEEDRSNKLPPIYIPVKEGNTGDGNSDGTSAPVDFKLPESEYEGKHIFPNKVCRLRLFEDLLSHLEQSNRVQQINAIQVNGKLGDTPTPYSCFPVTYSKSGRASSWQYINYFKGMNTENIKFKYRRSIIAEVILTSSLTIYLIETERRCLKVESGWVELDSSSLFLAIADNSNDISHYQFRQLLEDCSSKRGTWSHDLFPRYINSFSIKHPSNSALDDYPTRQTTIIEKYVGFSFD